MFLKCFTQNGMTTIWLDDDATDEDISRAVTIAAEVPQGNGRNVNPGAVIERNENDGREDFI